MGMGYKRVTCRRIQGLRWSLGSPTGAKSAWIGENALFRPSFHPLPARDSPGISIRTRSPARNKAAPQDIASAPEITRRAFFSTPARAGSRQEADR